MRSDTERLLRSEDLVSSSGSGQVVAWDSLSNCIVSCDRVDGRYDAPSENLALRGEYIIATVDGAISCQPVFERYAALCKKYTPEVIEATCWIPRGQLEKAAGIIWHSRPVSYYAYSGHEHHANATETAQPTAALADIVLPVASCFECEALRVRFEISEDAQSHVQLRQAIVAPPGQARSDTDFIFALAVRLGLGDHFWSGNVEEAYRYQLGPSGITLDQLRAEPAGLRKPLTTHHMKHAARDEKGNPRGFSTPSRKIEFWSETFLDHGYPALPDFVEPPIGPVARPDLTASYPLILTCAKPSLFCQTQHRALPSLPQAHSARGDRAQSRNCHSARDQEWRLG